QAGERQRLGRQRGQHRGERPDQEDAEAEPEKQAHARVHVRLGQARHDHHGAADAHEHQEQAEDLLDHQLGHGRAAPQPRLAMRRNSSSPKPTSVAVMNGNTRRVVRKMARIFGTNDRVISCIWVSAWSSATATPTTSATPMTGAPSLSSTKIAWRATSITWSALIARSPS